MMGCMSADDAIATCMNGFTASYLASTYNGDGEQVNANSNMCGCHSQNIDGDAYSLPPGDDGPLFWSAVTHPEDDYWVFCCDTGMCQSKESCPDGDDFTAYSEWDCDFADAVKGFFAALGIALLVIIVVIVLIVVLIIWCCCCKGGNKTAASS
jgi:hypothetical protein